MNTKRLQVAISSGGTRVFIDDMRCITNASKGTTGQKLAEEAICRGYAVNYVCSADARKPFDDYLKVDRYNLEQNPDGELQRLLKRNSYLKALEPQLNICECNDFYDYQTQILDCAKKVDVLVLAIAASDYAPSRKVDGKISSNSDEFNLTLIQLPKVISAVKSVNKNVFLVGFKALKNVSPDELVERAYSNMLRDQQDLCVANIVNGEKKFASFQTYIVTIEKGIIAVPGRNELPKVLWDLVEKRFSVNHYHSNVTISDKGSVQDGERDRFIQDIKRISRLSLFPVYTAGSAAEFGFVAKRVNNGMMITSRGSSKSNADKSDVVFVNGGYDEATRQYDIISSDGKKASLNANVAQYIFSVRPEIKYVVHAHIYLPMAVVMEDAAPGTQEDVDRVKHAVLSGATLIYQKNHGVLILLEDILEIDEVLSKNNIYSSRAECYDIAYSRFHESAAFEEVCGRCLNPQEPLLDFAGGTGLLSEKFIKVFGFNDITLLDSSDAMLKMSQKRLGNRVKYCSSLADIRQESFFGAIVIRQAINYLHKEYLAVTFSQMHKLLKHGGKLIFNTFVLNMKTPAKRKDRYEFADNIVITEENNIIDGDAVTHTQRSDVFNKVSGSYECIYDYNVFQNYSDGVMGHCLIYAGFSVEVIKKEKSLYFIATK